MAGAGGFVALFEAVISFAVWVAKWQRGWRRTDFGRSVREPANPDEMIVGYDGSHLMQPFENAYACPAFDDLKPYIRWVQKSSI